MIRTMIVILLVTSSAHGQPAGAQAEVLFREGRKLMAAGKLPEACAAFEQSQKLEPATTTLLNLAGCREKNGQLATAWGLFLDAERQTRAASDRATRKLHDVATDRARKLEARVSKLTIRVPPGARRPGLEISRDEEPVAEAMWDRALPLDGGTYTITARAPGAKPWSTRVTVGAEGDLETIDVPVLQELPHPAAPSRSEEPRPEAAARPRRGSRVLPIALGAGAAALLGGAFGFSRWGDSLYDDAKAERADQDRRDSLYRSANSKRYIAGGLAVGGVACAGVAVWLYLRGRHVEPDKVARARRVILSPAGIAIVGRF